MALRLGSFNVENLFKRAKALNTATWPEGEPVLIAFERFNALANRSVYTDADKQAMLAALETLQVLVRTRAGSLRLNTEPFDAWALLRENRGDFLVQPASGDARIVRPRPAPQPAERGGAPHLRPAPRPGCRAGGRHR
jgi:hypothetical protein